MQVTISAAVDQGWGEAVSGLVHDREPDEIVADDGRDRHGAITDYHRPFDSEGCERPNAGPRFADFTLVCY